MATKKADDNPDVTINLIATFDDIRLYRVELGTEQRIYVAARANGELDTNWTHQVGRTQRDEKVQTVR